jgi:putative ABC transport system permease protein
MTTRDDRENPGRGAAVLESVARKGRRFALLAALLQDVRHCIRIFRRSPGFTAAAVVTLALGIGAATALFTLVYDVVLNPFPLVPADRLLTFRVVDKLTPRPLMVTGRQLIDLQRTDVLDGVLAFDVWTMTLTGKGVPEALSVQYFSTNGLTLYGLSPVLGRLFSEADAPLGSEPPRVVVLTHHYWQSRFGGRPEAIGQTLLLNREPFEVIGVLAPGAFREGQGGGTDIVVPLYTRLDPKFVFPVFGRLRPGVDVRAAEAALQPLFQQLARDTPHLYPQTFRVELSRFVDARRSSNYVPTILLIFAAAVLLLVLACVNVSVLLLARGAAREQ